MKNITFVIALLSAPLFAHAEFSPELRLSRGITRADGNQIALFCASAATDGVCEQSLVVHLKPIAVSTQPAREMTENGKLYQVETLAQIDRKEMEAAMGAAQVEVASIASLEEERSAHPGKFYKYLWIAPLGGAFSGWCVGSVYRVAGVSAKLSNQTGLQYGAGIAAAILAYGAVDSMIQTKREKKILARVQADRSAAVSALFSTEKGDAASVDALVFNELYLTLKNK